MTEQVYGRPRSPDRQRFLTDVLAAAVEGGINDWARIRGYRWFDPELVGGTAEPGPGGTCNAYAVITPGMADFDGELWPKVNGDSEAKLHPSVIARGIGRIRRNPALVSQRVATLIGEADRTNDAGNIDAALADVIVQVAVFGEVVFA